MTNCAGITYNYTKSSIYKKLAIIKMESFAIRIFLSKIKMLLKIMSTEEEKASHILVMHYPQ